MLVSYALDRLLITNARHPRFLQSPLHQVAHGNSALALFLTVATNLLAVVTVPFLLRPLLSGDSMIHIHPGVRPSVRLLESS